MWSTNKKDSCFRTSLLFINCVSCIAIVYIYLIYVDDREKTNVTLEDFIQTEKLTSNCTSICDSRACIWHANLLLRYVNSAVNPCENFNSFLCSGFQQEFGPLEKGNVILETNQKMLLLLKGILDNTQATSESALEKVKTVYDSCINYGSSELQGITELKNFFNKLGFLNWPHLAEDFKFNDTSLPVILGNFITYGARQFIQVRRVDGNETDEDYFEVSIASYAIRNTEIARELAVSMLKYFDLETDGIDTIITDYEFVRESFIDFYKNQTYCTEENCPLVRIDCSQKNNEDWQDFCETVGFILDFVSIDEPVNKSSIKVEEVEVEIFKKLFPYLKSLSNRSLANFIALNFIQEYQKELNFYFRLRKLKQKNFRHEVEIEFYELDRWKHCVRWIADNMKLPLVNEFFHQYLTKEVTEELVDIYNDFSSEILDLIALQEWISDELKSNLQEQIQNITFNIDIVSRILPNDTYVNKAFEKFLPTNESFLSNVLQLKRFSSDLKSSIQSFTREESIVYNTNFEVNAFAGGRSLDFQYGLLMPPFYIPGHSSVINHLLISSFTGHEFGHYVFQTLAMDDVKKLLEKAECIKNQLSEFKFEYLNEYLNGTLYLTESVPDNVGTALIDKIIEKYSVSEDIILPGLSHYSAKQFFYMSVVQMWCSKSSLKRDIQHTTVDFHAPDAVRLINIMQNSRGYPEAFECPVGSFMNPATKCSFVGHRS